MKKSILILAIAAIVSGPASAELRWGVRGGLNKVDNDISSINSVNALSETGYSGMFLGPMAEFNMGCMALDLSLLYSQSGMEISENEDIRKQSVAIPLYLRYTFDLSRNFAAFGQAGGEFDYNIGDMETAVKSIQENDASLYQIKNFAMNQSAWYINIGAGLKFFNHLQLALTYHIPVTQEGVYSFYDDMTETVADDIINIGLAKDLYFRGESKIKSSALQMSMTITF